MEISQEDQKIDEQDKTSDGTQALKAVVHKPTQIIVKPQISEIDKNQIVLSSQKEEQIKIPLKETKEEIQEDALLSPLKKKVSTEEPSSPGKVSASNIKEHSKKYTIDDNSDGYFTSDQLKYYEEKYKMEIAPEQNSKVTEWKKLEEIGRGSFGFVFSGFNSKEGRPIAVKQLMIPNKNNNKSTLRSLKLEIDLLSKLNHKNIVAYYGCETVDDKLNIFLEYVGGGSLQSTLHEYGKLKEKTIKKYTKQILEGLEYLHYKKVS